MGHRSSNAEYGYLSGVKNKSGHNYKFDDVYLWGPYNPSNEGYDNSFYKIS